MFRAISRCFLILLYICTLQLNPTALSPDQEHTKKRCLAHHAATSPLPEASPFRDDILPGSSAAAMFVVRTETLNPFWIALPTQV